MSLAVTTYESATVSFFVRSLLTDYGGMLQIKVRPLCWLYKTYSDIDFSAVLKCISDSIGRFEFFTSSYIIHNYTKPVKYSDNIMVSATVIFYHYKFSDFFWLIKLTLIICVNS